MELEPILLLASLRTIFDAFFFRTLRTCIKWDKLLIKFFILLICRWIRVLNAILLVLPDVLQWTFIIPTFAHVDHFIIWRGEIDLRLFSWANDYSTCVHHCVINTGCRIKTYSWITTYSTEIIQSLSIFRLFWRFRLHYLSSFLCFYCIT